MNSNTELIIYTTDDGVTKVEATFDGDTVWLSQEQMGELFQRDKSTISRHIRNIFIEGELDEKVVVAIFATTTCSSNSPSLKILEICSLIVDLLLLNKETIWS